MANAFKRIGYGRFNTEDTMSEEQVDQTGYGNKVVINPETIDGNNDLARKVAAVNNLVDTYNAMAAEQSDIDWYEAGEEPVVANPRELTKYEIQEAKRAPKIQVDQKVVLWSWLVAIGVAFISSAIVSFNGITAVAGFVGLSATWMAGLFFFFIELMYLIFLVAYLVLASRVDENGKPEKTWGSLLGMVAFGGIAVLANAFHTLDYWAWDITNPQVWAGVILSVAAPIAIISASKLASRVVFAKAIQV